MKSVLYIRVITIMAGLVIVLSPLVALGQKPAGAGGVRLWTCDMVCNEKDASATGMLRPIHIVGARNGIYSGKVVVEATGAVNGVNASISALTGPSSIPAANVQVRFGVPWDGTMFWGAPNGTDGLRETAPAQVNVPGNRGSAYAPVWVTVKVPKDAKPGTYAATLTVSAQGLAATPVPVKLDVCDWTIPDPQNYGTWLDFIQSPDTLALEYNVPLWSDKHWDLIARSFRLLSDSGARVLYIPLICHTNFGNDESMVRWMAKGNGSYDYDFSIMDKYLDCAQKNLGQPKLCVFVVWDICMSMDATGKHDLFGGPEIKTAREDVHGKGPRVTAMDPASKALSILTLPRYEDAAASKPLWGPLFTQLRKDMAARGLEKTMLLGIMPDLWPNKAETLFLKDVSGDLAWACHSHVGARGDIVPGNKLLYKISGIDYAAHVTDQDYNTTVDKGREYGWKQPGLSVSYMRGAALQIQSIAQVREAMAFNITGGQRGLGRIGGDIWPVIKNRKGLRDQTVWARYPENNWRNLDIMDWFIAPGPDGAVGTARLESLREGVEVCQARIFLESALLDAAQKSKLGADLAQRCQTALDEHFRAMWKTTWNNDADLAMVGSTNMGRFPLESLMTALLKSKASPAVFSKEGLTLAAEEAKKGMVVYVNGWQDREKKLYDLCGEAAIKLGIKP